ncbi:hypothetical protein Trco_006741 [Trichoderma cornu-damae]|uniref:Uncharacterized protein n=1 Tax=Trichoderma cornu-damae TaxID=654480 RepID=A0A9P8TVA9_9HYPO|nr:hypothetical protein Trco_006741 [Trichoderma cornu-damae]
MAQAVAFEEHHVDPAGRAPDAGDEIARRPPAQGTLEAIDGLAGAVELSLAGVDSDCAPGALVDRVDGHKRAIPAPANRRRPVLVRASNAQVDLVRNRGISERLGAAPLELRLFLAPPHGNVSRRREILGCHGDFGDGVVGAPHEDHGVGLCDDGQQLFVRGPSGGGDAGIDGPHNLNVKVERASPILSNRDDVAAFQNDTCCSTPAQVCKVHDSVDEETGTQSSGSGQSGLWSTRFRRSRDPSRRQ